MAGQAQHQLFGRRRASLKSSTPSKMVTTPAVRNDRIAKQIRQLRYPA